MQKKLRRKQPEFKSKFEGEIAKKYPFLSYEVEYIHYIVPETRRKYLPDWEIEKGVYIETKGKLTIEDRKKLLLVKEQHPDKKIYLLFQNASNKLSKNSTTTYGDWCDKNEIEWSDWKTKKEIPRHWFGKKKTLKNIF